MWTVVSQGARSGEIGDGFGKKRLAIKKGQKKLLSVCEKERDSSWDQAVKYCSY